MKQTKTERKREDCDSSDRKREKDTEKRCLKAVQQESNRSHIYKKKTYIYINNTNKIGSVRNKCTNAHKLR